MKPMRLYRTEQDLAEWIERCVRLWIREPEWRDVYPTVADVVKMCLDGSKEKPEERFPWWPRFVRWDKRVSYVQWWRFRISKSRGLPFVEFARFDVEPVWYDRVFGLRYPQIPCHRCRGAGNLYSTFSIRGRFCEECGGGGYEAGVEAERDPENSERWKRQRVERYAEDFRRFTKTGGAWFSPWWNGGPA